MLTRLYGKHKLKCCNQVEEVVKCQGHNLKVKVNCFTVKVDHFKILLNNGREQFGFKVR